MKATEAQKKKMDLLGICYDDETTVKEAREALMDYMPERNEVTRKCSKDISENALVENSDFND